MATSDLKLNNASGIVTLDPEVLTLILESIEDKTELLVAMNSGYMVYEGRRWMAKNLTHDDLRSLRDFMATRTPASFKALHTLDLSSICSLSEDDAVLLKYLLDKGTRHVKALILPNDDPFAKHEELLEPIASLRYLQSVTSTDNSPSVRRFVLPRLRSPLTHICLRLDHTENALPLIANFTSTLESAEILGIPLWTEPLCFPKLTRLHFYGPHPPNLPMLVALFPNVKTLGLGDEEYSEFPGLFGVPLNYEIGTPLVDAIRQSNLEFQEHDRCWEHLEDIDISANALYATALQVRAKSLEVPWLCGGLEGDDMPWFLSSLEKIRPEQLTVAVADEDALAGCLSKGCENVSELKLILTFFERHDVDEDSVMNALLEGLAHVTTSLRVLELEFFMLGMVEKAERATRADEVDVEACGPRIQAVLPHLHWASIALEDYNIIIKQTVFESGKWSLVD